MGRKTLIKNACIVDGTGTNRYFGSVRVYDDRIVDVGNLSVETYDEVIDGSGKILAPGFIDTHSHSDLMAIEKPELLPKIMQGITTEMLGQDGVSLSPLPKVHINEWRQNLAGLDGESDTLNWEFETTTKYMDMMEQAGPATNVGYLAPHGNVRMKAMGLEGRKATPEEIQTMCQVLEDEMNQGCFGMSTGLIYIPCAFAETEELIELCKVVARHNGVFVVHQRSEADDIINSMKEILRIGRESGVKVHFSHFKVCGTKNRVKIPEMLALLEQGKAEGIRISFDQYPYVAGSTVLSVLLPPWAHNGGTNKLLERLAKTEERERMKQDIINGIPGWDNFIDFAGFAGIYITSVHTDKNQWCVGKNLEEIAKTQGKDLYSGLFDLLLEEENAVGMVDYYGKEEDVKVFLSREEMNACTDGLLGGKPHPRVYGAFPRILGKYVREEGALSLEEAIYKMTKKAADAMNIIGRGQIKEGYYADLVLFDANTIKDIGTFTDPMQYPIGIDYVFVNGAIAVEHGKATGNHNGTVIKTN